MTNELITDEMVEIAAKARWDYERAESGDTTEWEMRHPAFREFDVNSMRAALEAVAPTIAAQALNDAADALYTDEGPDHYLSTATWLRDRAKLTAHTEPREDHAATDPLDEDDHRPRHDDTGDCWVFRPKQDPMDDDTWMDTTGEDYGFRLSSLDEINADYGPLTFCDCPDPTDIEAESGATD